MWEKLKLITSSVWTFLQPIIKIFLSSAGQILAESATKAVTAVAINYGTADGDTKRQAAFDMIVADLKKQGIELGTSVVNLAIETALQKFKAQ